MKNNRLKKYILSYSLLASSLLISSCNITLTAPLNIDKTMYITFSQQIIDNCKSITITGNPKGTDPVLNLRVPQFFSGVSEFPKPYHIGLAINNYPISDLTKTELDGQVQGGSYFSQIKLNRAGTYVYNAALSGTITLKSVLSCQSTSAEFPIIVSSDLDVSPSSFDAPVVFRISQTSNGGLTATLKEFPKGTTSKQLDLP